jgi:hypothetical protein
MKTRKEKAPRRDKSEYYAGWYAENSQDVNAKRRERYQKDIAYREVVKTRARERKREVLAMRNGRVLREINGKQVLVYPVTWICRESGFTSQYIRDLEVKGWIPGTTFFDATRVYSEHQTRMIMQLLEAIHSEKNTTAIRQRL